MAKDNASNSQIWSVALRRLMGYPLYVPACDTIGWSASAPRDLVGIIELTQVANDMNRDLVHLTFSDDGSGSPTDIGLAIRRDRDVAWIGGCRLYTASESARLEIIAGDERWYVGPRQVLVATRLPPRKRIVRGEARAMARWRRAAEEAGRAQLLGSIRAPRDGRFADAIPQDTLSFAAAA